MFPCQISEKLGQDHLDLDPMILQKRQNFGNWNTLNSSIGICFVPRLDMRRSGSEVGEWVLEGIWEGGEGGQGQTRVGQGICPLSIWDGDKSIWHGHTSFIQDKDKTWIKVLVHTLATANSMFPHRCPTSTWKCDQLTVSQRIISRKMIGKLDRQPMQQPIQKIVRQMVCQTIWQPIPKPIWDPIRSEIYITF